MRDRRSGKIPRIPELDEEFQIVRELGKGGTAVVYLARDRTVPRDVAIKLISPSHVRDEDAVARLIREAQTVGKLQHPNIVMLLGTRALSDGGLALILQYVPGRTLKERIQQEGALPYDEAERILREVAQALGYAHRQRIAHRDIKPENVYLDESCNLARLADFGIARAWDSDSGLTLPGAAIGTPAYMSPEQVDGDELDGRSDLYSLGLVGYEMLTGQQPWAGESLLNVIYKQKHEHLPPLTESRPDVPVGLRTAIEGAIRKKREERWPNAEAFLEALAGRRAARPEGGVSGAGAMEEGETGAGDFVGSPGGEHHGQQTDSSPPAFGERSEDERETPVLMLPSEAQRTPSVAAAAMALVVLVAMVLGIEAVVAGPGGFTHSLFGYVAPIIGSDPAEGTAGNGPTPSPDDGGDGLGVDSVPSQASVPPSGRPSVEDVLAARGATPGGGGPGEPDTAAVDVDGTPPQEDAPGLAAAGRPASAEVVRGTGQAGTVEGVLPEPLEVRVLSEDGEPLSGQLVRFDVADGAGRVEPAASRTDDRGIAQAIWVLGPEAGDQVVTATVAANPQASARFTARGSAPTIPIRSGVSAGGSHTCSIAADGSIRCWGANDAGQLGDGGGSRRTAAAAPVPQGPFATVVSGMSHVCALDLQGRPLCWGSNAQGQLGSSGAGARSAPTALEDAPRFSELTAGGAHTCGLTPDGAAFCWGEDTRGQLGDGSGTPVDGLTQVRSDQVFRRITAGWQHTCALDDDGAAWCWGSNRSGELGVEGVPSASVPQAVADDHRFSSLSAGASHTCGVRTDGSVLCWGSNRNGQLGNGTRESQVRPVEVNSEPRFREVVAGGVHSCGLTTDGGALCWGGNPYGQIGDGSTTDRLEPVAVAGDRTFSSLQAFGSHTCGQTQGGEILCWGYNVDGQLGDGTRENRSVPTGR